MATYTMYLRDAIENVYGTSIDPHDYEQSYEEVEFDGVSYGRLPVLPDNGKGIGLGYFPIFDEDYRKIITGKIIDEYYMREIGTETIDMFMFYLRKRMDQIMPYYNKLYESERLEYNPLNTMDIHSISSSSVEGTEEVTADNESLSTNESSARAVSQDLPQTMLAGNKDYATAASDTNSDSTVNASALQNSNATSLRDTTSDNRVTGYQGIASTLIIRYRESLLNIDAAILKDIEDCFMLVLNNGDAYTRNGWYN